MEWEWRAEAGVLDLVACTLTSLSPLSRLLVPWALAVCPERRLSPAPAPFILGAANPLLCVAAREAEMWKG